MTPSYTVVPVLFILVAAAATRGKRDHVYMCISGFNTRFTLYIIQLKYTVIDLGNKKFQYCLSFSPKDINNDVIVRGHSLIDHIGISRSTMKCGINSINPVNPLIFHASIK